MTFGPKGSPPQPRGRLALCVLASALLHGALLLGIELPSPNVQPPAPSVQIKLAGVEAQPERLPKPDPLAEPQLRPDAPSARPVRDVAAAATAPPAPASATTPKPIPARRLAASNPLALAQAVAQAAAKEAAAPLVLSQAPAPSEDFAFYLDAWRREVERVGQLNYPAEARAKKLAGTLRLRVTIAADGGLKEVRITQSSGHAVLDDAALRIVRLAAPYAPFSPTMRSVAEVLEIERSWQFRNSKLST